MRDEGRALAYEVVFGALAASVLVALAVRTIILGREVGPRFAIATAGLLITAYLAFACGWLSRRVASRRGRQALVPLVATAVMSVAAALAIRGALSTANAEGAALPTCVQAASGPLRQDLDVPACAVHAEALAVANEGRRAEHPYDRR